MTILNFEATRQFRVATDEGNTPEAKEWRRRQREIEQWIELQNRGNLPPYQGRLFLCPRFGVPAVFTIARSHRQRRAMERPTTLAGAFRIVTWRMDVDRLVRLRDQLREIGGMRLTITAGGAGDQATEKIAFSP